MESPLIIQILSHYEIGHKGQFGLGLSIVYKTVTMYGFKVEALNRKDGVSFVIHK